MFFSEVSFYTERSNVVICLNVSGPQLCQNYKARKLIPSFLYIAAIHNFTVSDTSWPTSPILCVHECTLNSISLPSLTSHVTMPRLEEF